VVAWLPSRESEPPADLTPKTPPELKCADDNIIMGAKTTERFKDYFSVRDQGYFA
jgi:hypothetical protein